MATTLVSAVITTTRKNKKGYTREVKMGIADLFK